jgi:hypothetical protein
MVAKVAASSAMHLAPTDPLAVRLKAAVQSGALDELARLLDEQPELADAQIAGRRGGWRTPLHLVTDWPGYFPNGPAAVRLLIEAGADPSAPSDDGPCLFEASAAARTERRMSERRGLEHPRSQLVIASTALPASPPELSAMRARSASCQSTTVAIAGRTCPCATSWARTARSSPMLASSPEA